MRRPDAEGRAGHPLTPWHARLIVAGMVAYALSPIDLIPVFVPVLGYSAMERSAWGKGDVT